MAKKGKKSKPEKVDGLNESDIKNLKKAIDKVWSWSYSRRLVIKRCDIGGGYSRCEKCKKRCPKIYVDHIKPKGTWDGDYIERTFVPSKQMQGLCKPCHGVKTKADLKAIKDAKTDFY